MYFQSSEDKEHYELYMTIVQCMYVGVVYRICPNRGPSQSLVCIHRHIICSNTLANICSVFLATMCGVCCSSSLASKGSTSYVWSSFPLSPSVPEEKLVTASLAITYVGGVLCHISQHLTPVGEGTRVISLHVVAILCSLRVRDTTALSAWLLCGGGSLTSGWLKPCMQALEWQSTVHSFKLY